MKVVSSVFPDTEIQEELKKEFPNVEFYFVKGIKEAEPLMKEAEVFISPGDDLTEAHIHHAENLKWIMATSAGVEKIPLSACKEKGILVTNVRGIHKIPMAEYALAMMLQYVKKFKQFRKQEEEEIWYRKLGMEELHGKTVVIIGVGSIGGEIARLAKAFGMRTLGVNRSGKPVKYVDELYKIDELNQILNKGDFIVSVLPSTKETVHLLTMDHFRNMKETAVFINIGRGDLVEESVLLAALLEKEIAHAILDVFHVEPLPKGHPYWKMENVTITPHISSITAAYYPRAFEIFKKNLHTYINKEKDFINQVDLIRGY